jgi:putative polyketide hydroxylase
MAERVERRVPVLVVGAGLVGLSTALALRRYGIPALVVERHVGTSVQPKARRFTFRTMEVFRSYGVAGEVYRAAEGLAGHQAMRAGRTLVESEQLPFGGPGFDPAALAAVSPETSCLVAQDLLEPVLLDAARRRGAEVEFGTELTGLAPDGDGVTATLRDPAGGTTSVRAGYLVGADGSRSTVRELLRIGRAGRGTLGRSVTVYFEADLGDLVRGREFNLCQVEHPDAPGAFASVDGRHRWMFLTGELLPVPGDPARWADLVRTALGVSDVDISIRSVQAWEPAMLVAKRFVAGRVLLAGDAAHVMPPFAAAGANTGIQDTADLAWKLALVRSGSAGPELLETYHTERHAAGWYTADQSSRRTGGLRGAGQQPELVHPLVLVAGFQYPAGGAVLDDGSGPAPMDRLELTGRPGTRLPHHALDSGRSTVDLVGTGPARLALLAGPAAAGWLAAADRLAAAGWPVTAHVVADPGWPDSVCVKPDGALLVRPDAIVAWRSATEQVEPPTDPPTDVDGPLRTLESALAVLLRRAHM